MTESDIELAGRYRTARELGISLDFHMSQVRWYTPSGVLYWLTWPKDGSESECIEKAVDQIKRGRALNG